MTAVNKLMLFHGVNAEAHATALLFPSPNAFPFPATNLPSFLGSFTAGQVGFPTTYASIILLIILMPIWYLDVYILHPTTITKDYFEFRCLYCGMLHPAQPRDRLISMTNSCQVGLPILKG